MESTFAVLLLFSLFEVLISSQYQKESVSIVTDRRGRHRPKEKVVYPENSKYMNGPCQTRYNTPGICKQINDCPVLWPELEKGTVANCFFHKNEPIACCPLGKVDKKPEVKRGKFTGCGKREGLNRGRVEFSSTGPVVDGVEAIPHSWPWMAAIFLKSGNGHSNFVCGGSLISKKYVLSAAHCFPQTNKSSIVNISHYFVVLGAHDLSPLGLGKSRIERKRRPIVEGVRYSVNSILRHPRYDPKMYYHDLSLIKLGSEVGYTLEIFPVCLPLEPLPIGRLLVNSTAYVTGWGDRSYGGEPSSHLREISLPITSHSFCRKAYESLGRLATRAFPQGINRGQICAGGVPAGGKDACQGDSGGPLVSDWDDGVFVQVGIVSFGYHCAEPNIPGVYTNITHYLSWILKHSDVT